jgi:Flp pilus assembly protein TadD
VSQYRKNATAKQTTKRSKSVSSVNGGTQAEAKRRRRVVGLGILLVGIFCVWYTLRSVSIEARRAMVAQALGVLETQPDMAEEMFLLADSTGMEPSVLAGLVEAQRRQGKLFEAEQSAKRWTDVSPHDADAWAQLAQLQRQQQRFVQAQESLRTGIESAGQPHQRDMLRLRLVEFSLLADDKDASFFIYNTLETPSSRDAFRNSLGYAQLLRLDGQWEEAAAVVQSILAQQPELMAARMLRGIIELDRQRYQAAVDDLSAVVHDAPDNKEAHYKLAMALRGLQRRDEANKHLKIAQELSEQLQTDRAP